MLVDKNARHAKKPTNLEACIFFGQLQNIFVVKIPASPAFQLEDTTTLIYLGSSPDLHQSTDEG